MLPILLIHGFPFDATMWQAQADFLRAAYPNRDILIPDLLGFGGSGAPPPEQASMEGYAEYIHALIQAYFAAAPAPGKVIVGGLSMGGYVLLALLRNHPEDVAGAMFFDTRADADTAEVRAGRLKSMEEVQKHREAVLEGLAGRILGKNAPEAVRRQTRAMMERQPLAAFIAAQSAMSRRRDQTDLLAHMRVPVLIVVGEEDVVTPPAVARAMRERMPQAMLVEIPDSGHMTCLEQPAAVNAAMEAFLRTIAV